MAVLKLESELNSEISDSGITIVDYYGEYCGPCKMLAPIMDRLGAIDGVKVIKVDTEIYSELASKEGVTVLPTIKIYKDGELVKTQQGVAPFPVFMKIIDDLK